MYNKIKKQNGERFAKAIRTFDNGIFDVPDLDKTLKYAGRDASPIMNYLVSLKDIKIEEHGVYKDPKDLAELAGYDYYHVTSHKQALEFQKYYADGEKLCTFGDYSRTDRYHVVWLIKKDYDKIVRGRPPKRDDPYGTSVMSIQMLKNGGFISIKNRYNHTVSNPDNTLNSNPNNIIMGLSQSLKHKFNVDFSSQEERLPENYIEINGKIIKYTKETNNIYSGNGFYVKDGEVIEIDKNKELMIENFVLNMQTKEIRNIFNDNKDSFAKALSEEIDGRKLQITKNENGNKCLLADGVEILEIKDSEIISLHFPNVTEIDSEFLAYTNKLTNLSMQNLTKICGGCFFSAASLTNVSMPNLVEIGAWSFNSVNSLKNLSMQNLTKMGANCFFCAKSLINVSMPNLVKMGTWSLSRVNSLKTLSMPKLEEMSDNCFQSIKSLARIIMPMELITYNMIKAIKKNSYPRVVDMVKNQALLNACQNTR